MENAETEERVTWVDWLMVALAVVSLLLLVVEGAFAWALDETWRRAIVIVDLCIVAVFGVEFAVRIARAEDRWRYAVSHWYDLVGMVPVSHPMLRAFRLVRLLRIAVITSRFVRATNRTFGEMTVEAVAERYKDVLVRAVGDQIILQSIDLLEGPFGRARIAETVGRTLGARRGDLRNLVHDRLQKVPVVRRLVRLPFSQDLIAAMEDVSLEVVVSILESDAVNQTVQDSFVGGLRELRRSVLEKDAPQETTAPTVA
jgi:voltage-gated potassium channel